MSKMTILKAISQRLRLEQVSSRLRFASAAIGDFLGLLYFFLDSADEIGRAHV